MQTEPTAFSLPRRIVTCPQCKGESIYHPSNPARPFCSPRCKALDLGAWANEDFRLAATGDKDTQGIDDI